MKLNQKIGIVGRGFVGSAVQFGFSPNVGCDAEVRVYDIDPNKSTHSLEETVHESDFIFLSVPTPSNEDGSINIDIVDSALNDISKMADDYNWVNDHVVLLRSTVIPGTTAKLQKKYKGTKQTTDRAGKKIGYGGITDKKGNIIPLEKWRLEQTQEKRSKRI